MDDISNKTLAILLVFAMAVSLGGTLISLNRLKLIGGPYAPITGFASSGTGTANLSISQDSSIIVVSNLIDFGVGIVNTSRAEPCNNATISSSSAWNNWTAERDPCWVSNATTPAMVLFTDTDFVVRNDGNINVTLTMDSTANNAATFIGGSTGGGPLYQYRAMSNESASGNACTQPTLYNVTWTDINATAGQPICNKLSSDNGMDEVRVAIKVRIPSDATGYKSDVLTFNSGP
jgi:hypothetical protein